MPRPEGRGTNLKFKKRGKNRGNFDPVATIGKREAISGYLATTTGRKRQQAKAYSAYANDRYDARARADKKGYSDAKRKRKK